jgi:hypothetical protein
MTEPAPTIQSTLASPAEQIFPKLTPAQVARIAAHGRVRPNLSQFEGAGVYSPSTPKDLSRRDRISRRKIWSPRSGRSRGPPISSKPASPECSRSATCGEAASSVWPRRSAKARSPSPSSIRCCTNRERLREHQPPAKPPSWERRRPRRPTNSHHPALVNSDE